MSADIAIGPLIVDIAGAHLTAEDRDLLCEPAVGGVILFTRNFENRQQLADLTAEIRGVRHGLLIMADYEGGRVQRFHEGFTRIPSMARLGALAIDDPEAARSAAGDLGWLVGHELGEVGIDLPLAPVADRDHGQSSVIGARAFSQNPETITVLAGAYGEGLEAGGSLATAKHFPGHGWVRADSHAELPIDTREAETLAADWQPFAELIDRDIASIMMAHVVYPAIDSAPASLSSTWIDTILRERLGFSGCVFCDDLSMGGAAAAHGDTATRVRAALSAGCDLLPVCNDRMAARAAVAALGDRAETGQARREAFRERLVAARSAHQDDPERRARAIDTAERLVTT